MMMVMLWFKTIPFFKPLNDFYFPLSHITVMNTAQGKIKMKLVRTILNQKRKKKKEKNNNPQLLYFTYSKGVH